jgi:GxxExxY protein
MKRKKVKLLYEDLTYKIRGAVFAVHKILGSGHKEAVYHKALAIELRKRGLKFVQESPLPISYENTKVGVYKPDFIIEDKIIVEIKAVPFVVRSHLEQMVHYLSATNYRLGLLINFGGRRVQIKRVIHDKAKG